MGLISALDFHEEAKSKKEKESSEVEYQLYSWGEIFTPFIGDREHSLEARHILRDFPFKLFSSSTPYDDPLPQKLCLTFKAPYEENDEGTFGIFPHEIAKEFSAFLSLVTRRRIFVSRHTRFNGLPIEQDIDLYQRSHFQERQRLREIAPVEIYNLLHNLQSMNRRIAEGFILALRLYHTAVEMMYTDPEFSYLFLVICLEAISSVVYSDFKPDNEEEFLNSRFPGWSKPVESLSSYKKTDLKNVLLKKEHFTFSKLSKFVHENLPERFWTETKDDAKPDYLTGIVKLGPNGMGQKEISHSDITIQKWEKIAKSKLKKCLQDIYDARSRMVHSGIRFPANIVLGHFPRIPAESMIKLTNSLIQKSDKIYLQIPPLLTFERLVSYSLVEFLRKRKK